MGKSLKCRLGKHDYQLFYTLDAPDKTGYKPIRAVYRICYRCDEVIRVIGRKPKMPAGELLFRAGDMEHVGKIYVAKYRQFVGEPMEQGEFYSISWVSTCQTEHEMYPTQRGQH